MKRVVSYIAAAAVLVLSNAAQAMADDFAVVVNRANAVNAVSMAELRKIVLAQATVWTNGKRISLVATQADWPGTLMAISGMNVKDFNIHLMRDTFNGGVVNPPKVLASGAQAKETIAGLPTALGFIRASDVDDSVKVIKVDGLAPGQSGYPVSAK